MNDPAIDLAIFDGAVDIHRDFVDDDDRIRLLCIAARGGRAQRMAACLALYFDGPARRISFPPGIGVS